MDEVIEYYRIMMKIELNEQEKQALEKQHKTERDRRVADRIKAVLLHVEGWSHVDIGQALRIRHETVHDHLSEYQESRKLKPTNGGSTGKLNAIQAQELIRHLEDQTYVMVRDIVEYVFKVYGIHFTVSGMTKWLHMHKFSYKHPKKTPSKADAEKQKAFIEQYQLLMKATPEDEPIEFGDGVHPTMATKVTYGWIRTGTNKPIPTTAARTRMNLFGSINLESMQVTIDSYETIDSHAMDQHFQQLRQKYPKASKIHLILDQGPYNKSKDTKASAQKHGVELHYLPPYSPNLNSIERLWKVMNEHVRNNQFFESAKDFREKIMNFFQTTWPQIADQMTSRINDNFQTLKQVPSG